ncbi:MAG: dienelactone hydrolase family protein [Rhizobiales bacterium]|nr:dienelactone hydrolase family protein [Hyphomicrobiales bacterium]
MRRFILAGLLAAAFLASAQGAASAEWVTLDNGGIRAQVFKPAGKGPFPAVIGLHGCAGMMSNGRLNARDQDWALRLQKAGFMVVLPDSFGSRGLGSQCANSDRTVSTSDRAEDAFAAAAWLAEQPQVNRNRIGVMGWSNGGTTALHVARRGSARGVTIRQIVAFYPGCRLFADRGFASPLTILHGLADDWTPAEPCRKFAGVRFIGYPGAHHDFDHPSMALRTRQAAFTAAGGPGTVTMGTHGPSRQKAIGTVMAIFRGM